MSDDSAMLAAALQSLENGRKPSKCSIGRMIEAFPDEVKEVIDRVMNNPGVSTRAIFDELRKMGYRVGRDTLSDHRNHRCPCPEAQ